MSPSRCAGTPSPLQLQDSQCQPGTPTATHLSGEGSGEGRAVGGGLRSQKSRPRRGQASADPVAHPESYSEGPGSVPRQTQRLCGLHTSVPLLPFQL